MIKNTKAVVYIPEAVRAVAKPYIRAVTDTVGGCTVVSSTGEWIDGHIIYEENVLVYSWWFDCQGTAQQVIYPLVKEMLRVEKCVMVEWMGCDSPNKAVFYTLDNIGDMTW